MLPEVREVLVQILANIVGVGLGGVGHEVQHPLHGMLRPHHPVPHGLFRANTSILLHIVLIVGLADRALARRVVQLGKLVPLVVEGEAAVADDVPALWTEDRIAHRSSLPSFGRSPCALRSAWAARSSARAASCSSAPTANSRASS